MASEGRMEDAGVTNAEVAEQLTLDPPAYGFFQAVRLLERLFPDRGSVGRFSDPAAEVVQFSARPVINFPASEIHAVDLPTSRPGRMVVNFMGLIGPLGVLPYHYTQHVAERSRVRDRALRDFLDMFQHRLISLFYRAWEKYHFTAAYERDGRDGVSEHLRDLIGLGIAAFRNRFSVPDEALLQYAGVLGQQPRSALALQQLLEDILDVPVAVEQFIGGWYRLSPGTQCRVGEETGPAEQLGLGAVVGDEMWDQQARVRLRLGPLTRPQYEHFLPNGGGHDLLRTVTRFFSHDQVDFEIQLVLVRDDVPGCVLGADEGVPLGWRTWLRTKPFAQDADDTILTL
jgi:type VI secretion system protein ImpH